MSKPGPRPQPTKIKVLKGGRKTYHRPMPKNEPQPKEYTRVPTPPGHLDRLGKNEWKRVAGQLHQCGLLTKIDRAALLAYCTAYSTWIAAQEQVRKHGVLIKSPSGFPMQSPYLQIANKAMIEMRKWLVEFGMTPSSRSRVEANKPEKKEDPLKEFLEKGGIKAVNKKQKKGA
jgi:P27 family predicted phage terminase small subunit